MLRQKSVRILTLGGMLASYTAFAKCDFSKEKEPIKTFAETFKKSEKLILGEAVSSKKDKGVELIQRAKTKSWRGFEWKIRPLELFAVMSSQIVYLEKCESKPELILNVIIDDLLSGKVPTEQRKAATQSLVAALPCLEDFQAHEVQRLTNDYFQKHTEDFLSVLIGAESETAKYAVDYKACSDKPTRKFLITDVIVAGIEREKRKAPLQNSLLLRLKRLRANKMHYKTAQYFFGKIDNLLINSADN